jgi:hypothetical protein
MFAQKKEYNGENETKTDGERKRHDRHEEVASSGEKRRGNKRQLIDL